MPLSSRVLDNGLATFQSEADKLYICNAQPTTFTEATSTFALGNKNWGAGNVLTGPSNAGSTGRKVTVVAITDGVETASGTATWWAIVDSANSRLLASDALDSSQSISGSVSFTLPTFDIKIPYGLIDEVYVGPGDIVSGAAMWWGLRAYSNATIGNNAIRLRRDGASPTEQDFVTVAGGGLDISSITSFKGSDNLFVVKQYDQSGNSRDMGQTTAANQPTFELSILSSLPSAGYLNSAARKLTTSGLAFADSIPTQTSVVAILTPTSTTGSTFATTSSNILFDVQDSSAIRAYSNGTNFTVSGITQGVWHAVQTTYNGASSVLYIDGTSNSGTCDTFAVNNDDFYLGSDAFSSHLNGYIMEAGLWTSSFSGTENSNMNTNQHDYYGF